MSITKNWITNICVSAILFVALFAYGKSNATVLDIMHISINSTAIAVEVANTPKTIQQGLSGRSSLKPGTGMWFVFHKPDQYGFWMADMRFPIDIIWVGSDLHIVDITKSAAPESYPNIFKPREPARYVLEVPAGFALHNAIKIGDRVIIRKHDQ
jgi:uncharacterized membrane protein (UPF0127 family)